MNMVVREYIQQVEQIPGRALGRPVPDCFVKTSFVSYPRCGGWKSWIDFVRDCKKNRDGYVGEVEAETGAAGVKVMLPIHYGVQSYLIISFE